MPMDKREMKKSSLWRERSPDIRRFPILQGEASADVVIIGGGIAGVMTAFYLVNKGIKTILLEKNHIATGDTGATTGFITRVPDTEMHQLEKKYGQLFLKNIFTATQETQEALFKLIKEKNIACEFQECDAFFGSYEANDPLLKKEWESVKKCDANAQWITSKKKDFPFKEAIQFKKEGRIHPRKFIFGILNEVKGKNFQVFEESEVINVSIQEKIKIETKTGTITTKKVVIAMGNPKSLFPEFNSLLTTKLTYVIAARYKKDPLEDALFWDTYDPYFYYRKSDEKTIILGGADIEVDKHETQQPYLILEQFLKKKFSGEYEITHSWSGSIFWTKDGLPYIVEHPAYKERVYIATGFCGNGLVFGTLAAQIIGDRITGEKNKNASLFSFERAKIKIKQHQEKMAEASQKQFIPIATLEEFGEKSVLCKTILGKEIALFKTEEGYYAIDNTCSHSGGPICEGTFDGKVVECPWHGARFDVKTGEVKGPPATRALETYKTRVNKDTIEIEIAKEEAKSENIQEKKKENNIKTILKFASLAIIFLVIQFLLQYFWLSKGKIAESFVRSFSFAGATLIGLALFSSAVFKWIPTTAKHWRFRRYLGVSGFVFVLFHALSVYYFYYQFNLKEIYFSFNPIKNPIVFGSIALPIFMIMALTSSDYMVNKLTPKVWKFIHRFVYIAYIAAIFHFTATNPAALNNPPGYLLILVTFLAIFGQIFWFFKIAGQKRFKSIGSLIGILLIIGTIILGILLYLYKFSQKP